MFNYLKDVIEDSVTKSPSTKQFILVSSGLSLCFGFLISIVALVFGHPISEAIVLGQAGILASMAGGSYAYTKGAEIKARGANGGADVVTE